MINDHHQFIRMEEVNETDIIAIDESENNDNVQEKRTDEEVSLGSSEKKSTNLPPIRAASTVWQYYEEFLMMRAFMYIQNVNIMIKNIVQNALQLLSMI